MVWGYGYMLQIGSGIRLAMFCDDPSTVWWPIFIFSIFCIQEHLFFVYFVLFFVVFLGQKPMKAGIKKEKIRQMTPDHVSRPKTGPGIDLDMLWRDPNTVVEVILIFIFFV